MFLYLLHRLSDTCLGMSVELKLTPGLNQGLRLALRAIVPDSWDAQVIRNLGSWPLYNLSTKKQGFGQGPASCTFGSNGVYFY
jgi:hypothetical protein